LFSQACIGSFNMGLLTSGRRWLLSIAAAACLGLYSSQSVTVWRSASHGNTRGAAAGVVAAPSPSATPSHAPPLIIVDAPGGDGDTEFMPRSREDVWSPTAVAPRTDGGTKNAQTQAQPAINPPREAGFLGFSFDVVFAMRLHPRTRWQYYMQTMMGLALDALRNDGVLWRTASMTLVVSAEHEDAAVASKMLTPFRQALELRKIPLDMSIVVEPGGSGNGNGSSACCGIDAMWRLASRPDGKDASRSSTDSAAGGATASRRLIAYFVGPSFDGSADGGGGGREEEDPAAIAAASRRAFLDVLHDWRRAVRTFAEHPDVHRVGWTARPSGVMDGAAMWVRQSYVREYVTPPTPLHDSGTQWLARTRRNRRSGGGGGDDDCSGAAKRGECEDSRGGVASTAGVLVGGSGGNSTSSSASAARSAPACSGDVSGCFAGVDGAWDLCSNTPSATGAECAVRPTVEAEQAKEVVE
jgi:hypothetical protein